MMPTVNPFTAARITALTEGVGVATRQQLVAVTREKTAENQTHIRGLTGHEAQIRRVVDGSPGKPLEQAQHFTLTEFQLIGDVVDAALAMLIERSPYGPDEQGHYRDDHWLFVNGQRRDAGLERKVVQIERGDRVVIMNLRPYARKIEGGSRDRFRGRSSNRRPGLSVTAPNGVYEISARELRSQYSGIASITFTYLPAMAGVAVRGIGRNNRFPALEITALAA